MWWRVENARARAAGKHVSLVVNRNAGKLGLRKWGLVASEHEHQPDTMNDKMPVYHDCILETSNVMCNEQALVKDV